MTRRATGCSSSARRGAYLNRFGQFGSDPAGLGLPNGLDVAADDTLWVADAGNHRVIGYPALFGGSRKESHRFHRLRGYNLAQWVVDSTVHYPLPTIQNL